MYGVYPIGIRLSTFTYVYCVQNETRRVFRRGPPLARLAQQAGSGRQQVAGGRGPVMVFGRERRQPDGRGTAATAGRGGIVGGSGGGGDGDDDREGRRRRIAGTLRLSGVQQFVSVWVVAAVQPRDRGHREQDERRERQVDDGNPKQRRVGAVENKARTMYVRVPKNKGLGRMRVENRYTQKRAYGWVRDQTKPFSGQNHIIGK